MVGSNGDLLTGSGQRGICISTVAKKFSISEEWIVSRLGRSSAGSPRLATNSGTDM